MSLLQQKIKFKYSQEMVKKCQLKNQQYAKYNILESLDIL